MSIPQGEGCFHGYFVVEKDKVRFFHEAYRILENVGGEIPIIFTAGYLLRIKKCLG